MKAEKSMSEYLLDGYIDNAIKLKGTTNDIKEKTCLNIIAKMLMNMKCSIKCVDYDDKWLRELDPNTLIDDQPVMVYLFDTERNMFWKNGSRGYTDYIMEAGMYPLQYAQDLIEVEVRVNRNNTKMVLFDI